MAGRIHQLTGVGCGTHGGCSNSVFKSVRVKTEAVEGEEDKIAETSGCGAALVVMRGADFKVELNADYYLGDSQAECKQEEAMDVDSSSSAVSSAPLPMAESAHGPCQEGPVQGVAIKQEKVEAVEGGKHSADVAYSSLALDVPLDSQPLTALQRMCSILPKPATTQSGFVGTATVTATAGKRLHCHKSQPAIGQRGCLGLVITGSGAQCSGLQSTLVQGVPVRIHSDSSGGGVDVHSDSSGGGVDVHSDSSGGGVDVHSGCSGTAVTGHGVQCCRLPTSMGQGVPIVLPVVSGTGPLPEQPSAVQVLVIMPPNVNGGSSVQDGTAPSEGRTVTASLPSGILPVQSCPPLLISSVAGRGLQGRAPKPLRKLAPKVAPKIATRGGQRNVCKAPHKKLTKATCRVVPNTSQQPATAVPQCAGRKEGCREKVPPKVRVVPGGKSQATSQPCPGKGSSDQTSRKAKTGIREDNETSQTPYFSKKSVDAKRSEEEAETGVWKAVAESPTPDDSSAGRLGPNKAEKETNADSSKTKHACPVCGREFSFKQNMTSHLNAVHLRDYKYQCSECGKKFRYARSRKGHVDSVHRGIRNHECPECRKRFTEKWSLKVHISTVHRKERNYTCSECGAKFGQKSLMTIHIRTRHLGITRYTCRFCDHEFYRKHGLDEHLTRRHGDEVLPATLETS